MRLIALFFILLCSTVVFAEEVTQKQTVSSDLSFNFTNFVEEEGSDISITKILGGLILTLLLISAIFRRRK